MARRPLAGIGPAGAATRPLRALALTLVAGCTAAPATRPAADGLAGTAWALEAVVSMADEQPTLRPDDPARYTLAFGADGRAQLRLDCNQASAGWQAEPAPGASAARRSGSLVFGPLASTRAACVPGSLAPRLARDLAYVRSYVIEGGRLHLALMADGGVLRWTPLPRGLRG